MIVPAQKLVSVHFFLAAKGMNTIKAQIDQSDYEGYADFLNYQIDGFWLDEYLDKLYPNQFLKGTVPTLLFDLEGETENKIVWERILPQNSLSLCPILMCPDDCDFYCTLIIAEIASYEDKISWLRLGLDHSKLDSPVDIGSRVDWFAKAAPFVFKREEYLSMLQAFELNYQAKENAYFKTTGSKNYRPPYPWN